MEELIGTLVAMIIVVLAVSIPAYLLARGVDRKERRARFIESAVEQGFTLVPDVEIPTVAKRVRALLQPPVIGHWAREGIGPVFSGRIGGRDVFLYRWTYTTLMNPRRTSTSRIGSTARQLAYIVLGLPAPYIRTWPKAAFGEPAGAIDFPEDPPFSRAFWVEGPAKGNVRLYLSPALRTFLLSMGAYWRFHAGPEGVALVLYSEKAEDPTSVAEMRAIFERLVALAEDAARR